MARSPVSCAALAAATSPFAARTLHAATSSKPASRSERGGFESIDTSVHTGGDAWPGVLTRRIIMLPLAPLREPTSRRMIFPPLRSTSPCALTVALAFAALHSADAQRAVVPNAAPSAGTVTPARLERPLPGEWLQNGRDYANTRYSPLTQISVANVARLSPRTLFQLEMPQPGAGAEATPVVADGRLFVTTDYDVVTPFDLRGRKRLWRYEPKIGGAKPCCGPVNRGVALGHGLVFL